VGGDVTGANERWRPAKTAPFALTARELEVAVLLCDGLRNAQIAARLCRSVRTIDHHVQAVLAKMGVSTRTAAVAAALRTGIGPASSASDSAAGRACGYPRERLCSPPPY